MAKTYISEVVVSCAARLSVAEKTEYERGNNIRYALMCGCVRVDVLLGLYQLIKSNKMFTRMTPTLNLTHVCASPWRKKKRVYRKQELRLRGRRFHNHDTNPGSGKRCAAQFQSAPATAPPAAVIAQFPGSINVLNWRNEYLRGNG